MVWIEDAVRIVSVLAALCLVLAGVRALLPFRIPRWILALVRGCYAVLWPVPAVAIACFASIVVRARWILGHWPCPGHIDPSLGRGLESYVRSPLDPGTMPGHWWLVLASLVLGLLSLPWGIPAYALLRTAGRPPHPATMSALVAGWVGLFLVLVIDPGGFVRWFVD